MLETSARLLRLLSLLQSRRFWSGPDLARELDVSERTLRRDVEKLRTLGYPVNAASGIAGGYRLGAGARLPPLLLDDDEALAVSFGLRSAAVGTVSGMEEAALRALDKLGQVLPARLRQRVASLHSTFVATPFRGPRVDPNVLTVLAGACHERTRLRFGYEDRERRSTQRDVEPHGLVNTRSRWYLVAWDHARSDWRTFRVDRIAEVPVVGPRFTARELPFGDLGTFVSRSLDAASLTHRAVVELAMPLTEAASCLPVGVGKLEALSVDRCLLETGSHDLPTLSVYLGLLGADFMVREPPELVEHLERLGARVTRAVHASKEHIQSAS